MMSFMGTEAELGLDDKQSATLINNFFVRLTNDFLPIKSECCDTMFRKPFIY